MGVDLSIHNTLDKITKLLLAESAISFSTLLVFMHLYGIRVAMLVGKTLSWELNFIIMQIMRQEI